MDVAAFRTAFPEFADTDVYTSAQVTAWSGIAEKLVNVDVWEDLSTFGIQLLTAHNLVLSQQNQRAAAVGGVPGGTAGQQSSKSVGDVSVSYDTQASAEKDAGMYNMTVYGKQFIHYAKLFGAGAIQL